LIGGLTSLQTANIFPGRQVNGSSITTAEGDPSTGQLSVYGYLDSPNAKYPAKLGILNLEMYNSTATYPCPNVTVNFLAYLAYPGQVATARTMTAPGTDIKETNVTTQAGQTFATGVVEGILVEEYHSPGGSALASMLKSKQR
ncbi:hypothetical protein EV363DRAFT_1565678, partial [Boletus edulis]